ncbi:MAG: PAS domain S-box protein [Candidatus Bathyarchaeota archaeon]|nr:PAS domain S-box protein [Candidatus Bathyarchaeota archaeon]
MKFKKPIQSTAGESMPHLCSGKNGSSFMELLNFLIDPTVIVDEKGNFLAVNDAIVNLTGVSKNALIGINFTELNIFTPETKALLLENLRKRMQGLHVEPYEISLIDMEGKTRYFELKAKKITYAGQPADVVILRDITRRKENLRRLKEYAERMEELVNEKVKQIRESEEKYRELINKMNDTVWVIGLDGKFIDVNDAAVRVLGYSRDELLRMGPADIDTSLSEAQILALIRSMPADHIKVFETTHRTKDGKIIPVEISSSLITYQGKQAVLSIARDITDRKKMEEAVKRERDLLEAVTENVGAGLGIISRDYRILWVNKYLRQYNPGCEGKICYSTFNHLTAVCPDCGVRKIFEEGVILDRHEYAFTGIDGKPKWAELIATPIKDEKGNVIAALELVVDITEKKQLQSKLREYSEKLEHLVAARTGQLREAQARLLKTERLAAIGELAAMVGHDLRNPLTSIMGASYYLKTKYSAELGAKGKEMLEAIEKAIRYSNKIINDLLEYSRDLKLECTETNPKIILQDALSLIEVPAKMHVVDATSARLKFKVDKEKMCEVFARIIQNAVDAMPNGGTLTVKSRKVNGKLEIIFKDTGSGMSKETLSKLEGGVPLFTTKARGMGFGLPICRRIVEAHGGKIRVKSALKKGTVVTVSIPVKPKTGRKMKTQLIAKQDAGALVLSSV